jgi:hypothetical protein
MDSLPLKDQKDLRELLALYDSLNLEIQRDGLNKDNAQRLYDVYDAMSNLLGDEWKKMPQVNN